LRLLLEHDGVDPNQADKSSGRRAVHLAMRKDNVAGRCVCLSVPRHFRFWCREDMLRTLVEHGADMLAADASGQTPLFAACAKGRHDSVRFLLEHGADPTVGFEVRLATPAEHLSALVGHPAQRG